MEFVKFGVKFWRLFLASNSRSMTHGHGTMTVTTDTKPILTPKKKNRNINQQREKSSTAGKMNKIKSNTSVTNSLSGSIRKRSARNRSKISSTNSITQQTLFMSTGLTSKPVDNGRASTTLNKSSMKSVTNAVISYLHYRGSNAAQSTGSIFSTTDNYILFAARIKLLFMFFQERQSMLMER